MPQESALPIESDRLRDRLRKLAEEKSNLQLILRMIEQINPAPGLHDMVGGMLQGIVETIGGTNIRIWYWTEEHLRYADILGTRCSLDEIDDAVARQVAETREFLELNAEAEKTLLRGNLLPGCWTWAFPLQVGADLVGVIKLENVYALGASLRNALPIFFSHAALILANEIRSHARLKAQAALRLAGSVFANSQEGILITNADNHVIDVNAAFSAITGYAREEMLGKNPRVLQSGRQCEGFYREMWNALQRNGRWRGEIWNRRKTGEIFAEMLSIDAVRDESGELLHYVGTFSDISQIKAQQDELERIAHYDVLTGLPNRRMLVDRLRQSLARSQRHQDLLALCYLDLDGFKPVNDQLGHDAGDQLLVEVGQRLQKISRAGDTVARLGGDEFVLIFCELAHEKECLDILERILASIKQTFRLPQGQVSISASIGVTLFPHDAADAETLMRHADQAMYQAKQAGKGGYVLFDAEQDRQIKANQASLQRLESALRQGEFFLVYQPKIDMVRSELIGVEALLRWQHPERGLLCPVDFLPLLNSTALEIELGEWVIDTALTQMECWQQAGLRIPVSLNVGGYQLAQADFIERLGALLQRHPGIRAEDVELEVLESTAIEDLNSASRILNACNALGLKLSLDDFGTGYSSLTYFRKLPIGALKIDQGFVHGMLDDPEDLSIIESVIGLARAFNRPVIAEGVESLEHGRMLVQLGCPLGQGFGIAHPMPAAELPDWIAHWRQQPQDFPAPEPALAPEDLALLVAARSQERWVETLLAYVRNPAQTHPPELQSHLCPFGRWYFGGGIARYGHLAVFRELETQHAALHRLGEELIALRQQPSFEAAQARIPELLQHSTALGATLRGLAQDLRPRPA